MRLLESLIEQSKRPENGIGKWMLKIMNRAHLGMMHTALSKVRIGRGDTVLDIGCGGGETVRLLAARADQGTVYGLDYSETSVAMSLRRNRQAAEAGRVRILQGEVSKLPFGDGMFDLVTAIQTHYYWPDLPGDVKEVYRTLKPGGQFIISSEIYKVQYHMEHFKTAGEMEQLFRATAFADTDEENAKSRHVIGIRA